MRFHHSCALWPGSPSIGCDASKMRAMIFVPGERGLISAAALRLSRSLTTGGWVSLTNCIESAPPPLWRLSLLAVAPPLTFVQARLATAPPAFS